MATSGLRMSGLASDGETYHGSCRVEVGVALKPPGPSGLITELQ